MSYYFNTVLDMPFDTAIERVTDELQKEGFGILSTIDVQAALKKKLGVDLKKYNARQHQYFKEPCVLLPQYPAVQ